MKTRQNKSFFVGIVSWKTSFLKKRTVEIIDRKTGENEKKKKQNNSVVQKEIKRQQ